MARQVDHARLAVRVDRHQVGVPAVPGRRIKRQRQVHRALVREDDALHQLLNVRHVGMVESIGGSVQRDEPAGVLQRVAVRGAVLGLVSVKGVDGV